MAEEGTAASVSLRDMWEREEDFSRWLGENIHILDQQIKEWTLDPGSVRLEVAAWNAAKFVDVLCDAKRAETDASCKVVIENQFNGTDMDHFTRFMQYISIHDAKCAVWIAGYAYPGYVQVIQWLNDNSEVDVYLFTIELEQRENADPKPVLTLVSGPDTERVPWDLSLARNEKVRLWYSYVLPKVAAKCLHFEAWQDLSPNAVAWRTQYIQYGDGNNRGYITWYIYVLENRTSIGVHVSASPKDESHYYFDELEKRRREIDCTFDTFLGESLRWERTGAAGNKYIHWINPVSVGYECTDDAMLEKEANVIAEAMARLINATKDVIAGIEPHQPPPSDDEDSSQ